jgi:hypothetical protein
LYYFITILWFISYKRLPVVGSTNFLAVLGFYRLDPANHLDVLPFHDLDTTNHSPCPILS